MGDCGVTSVQATALELGNPGGIHIATIRRYAEAIAADPEFERIVRAYMEMSPAGRSELVDILSMVHTEFP